MATAVALASCGDSSDEVAYAAGDRRAPDALAMPAPNAPLTGGTPTGTPLHTRLSSAAADGNTGQALTATLSGATFPSATGVWVGCEGTPATAGYHLAGEFTSLRGVLGLQPHTPENLAVTITVSVDGQSKFSIQMRLGDGPRPIQIDLSGARAVTISALAVGGRCAPAAMPYGAIGAASLI